MIHTERIDKGRVPWFPQTASIDAETPSLSCAGSEQADFFQISDGDALVLVLTFGTASDGFFQSQVLNQTANRSEAQTTNLCS